MMLTWISGFGVGIAISGIVQTFALDFTGEFPFKHRRSNSELTIPGVGDKLDWWGISVTTAGVDFRA